MFTPNRCGYAVGGVFNSAMKSAAGNLYGSGANEDAKIQEVIEGVKLEKKKFQSTLVKFKTGKLNCLVATACVEEGLDIQTCNLVVRFDQIQTFRSYVQSKGIMEYSAKSLQLRAAFRYFCIVGRARAKPSRFIIMTSDADQTKTLADLREYRFVEKMMIENSHDIRDSLEEQDDDEANDPEFEEPYVADPTDPNSPRVTENGAVSLVHRFVQSVPTDR